MNKPPHTIHRTALTLLLLLHTLAACRTTHPLPAPTRNREQYIHRQHTDTLLRRDSIYIERRGDTLHIEKYHTRWRITTRHDTIHTADTQYIPYPVEHTRTVSRPLSRWQQLIQAIGYLTLITTALYLCHRLRR